MLKLQTSMLGQSEALKHIFETVQKVAQTDSTVLVTGESGTGKELVARAIHDASPRAARPYVVVNCGAIPSELLEAELFGHVKGAFTGATQNRLGRFEMAHTGTLLLDEVGECPLSLQVKLLRVLQTRQFEPLGSSRPVEVDVRILAATNRNLEDMVLAKQFREDLFYRLNVIPIKIPALRLRKEDISLLVNHFLKKCNSLFHKEVSIESAQVWKALLEYDWPGNVRELENLVERLVILRQEGQVSLDDLPQGILASLWESPGERGMGATAASSSPLMHLPEQGLDLRSVVQNFENHLIDQALERTGGNKNRASELLCMNRTTLVEKLRKRGLIVSIRGPKIHSPLTPDVLEVLEEADWRAGHA